MAQTCALFQMKQIRIIGFCSSVIVFLAIVLSLNIFIPVNGKPYEEIFPTYGHRDFASAISTLKSLDNQYNKISRPRFGKRMLNNFQKHYGEYPLVNLVTNGPTSDDWIMVNRALPLSKFSQSYLLQLLSQNDKMKVQQLMQQYRESIQSKQEQQEQQEQQKQERERELERQRQQELQNVDN